MHSPELSRDTATAGEAVAHYLHAQAGDFLRSLRLHGESGADTAGASEAARALRAASRRISGTLYTFRPLVDPAWADGLRTELGWLSSTLALEHACTSRLSRLLDALSRLSGASPLPPTRTELSPLHAASGGRCAMASGPGGTGTGPMLSAPTAASGTADAAARGVNDGGSAGSSAAGSRAGRDAAGGEGSPADDNLGAGHGAGANGPGSPGRGAGAARGGVLNVGAARAGALLERQLTLARTRAHSAALQALGSSRFHAVADAVALLASDLPLAPAAAGPAVDTLGLLAEVAERRLLDAVAQLPLGRAAHPYNADALVNGLATATAGEEQDAPWHEVRRLVRLHRYAQEVLHPGAEPVLCHAGRVLDHHRDAAEASEAAAAAARTPRIAPATAYALGVLHADQRHEVEAARFAFQQEWRHATVTVSAP
ncbi:CHAD domain-containing protein [Streptomyces sp. PKU-EA00015]|uniref:CHAD domain-containing protein n=1 Tax=Streptomyces sp. PKU-EA00015 TaxID=2748326 RepID=UPI0015A343B4|nr:CHAD domain-containing protein [Streptomyces sp. PKU-EA00015]NWF27715.1 CHAD domain-containing protein [Streptomyces sp. PKU-EA00015]